MSFTIFHSNLPSFYPRACRCSLLPILGPNAASCPDSDASYIKFVHEIRIDVPTTLYAMALQPTKRGSWRTAQTKNGLREGAMFLRGGVIVQAACVAGFA